MITVLGLIILFWYVVFYHGSLHQHTLERTIHQKAKHEVQVLHHALLHYKAIEHDYHRCEKDFILATKDSYQEHDVIAYLISSMKNHQIQCISFIPLKKETGELCNQSLFMLIACARFDRFIHFFKEIGTADYLIEFHDVVMLRSENNELELKAEIGVCTVIPS
jgi:hypothetical protein